MRSPYSYPVLLIFLGLLIGLTLLVQIGALTLAFHKLGLSPLAGYLLLMAALLGSSINIPLFMINAEPVNGAPAWPSSQLLGPFIHPFRGKTIIAVNLGGCVIPVLLSVFLLVNQMFDPFRLLIAIAIVTVVSYSFSRPIPGMGIGMPILLAPVMAALSAGVLDPEHRGTVAYISGVLGVLIGADLLRLKDIRKLGTPVASIGGAGTFDGIFLTGIVAVLLA